MLEVSGIELAYGPVKALAGVDLRVEPGEIVALTGPSGAGKTTTLHVVAGVLTQTRGEVRLAGRDISDVPTWKRDVALVQETYALYPHLNVWDNIAFPLRSPRTGKPRVETEIASLIRGVADVLEIGALLGTQIQRLSGGQRQRVALARALVQTPQVFLLDEPIAHLDAKLRHWLRGELRRRLTATERPCLWTTPDGKEALSVADRIGVIVDGQIVQFGEPREVFQKPATARVAEIVSEPPISLLRGSVDAGQRRLLLEGIPLPLEALGDSGARPSGDVLVGVRPSSIRLVNGKGRSGMRGHVLTREFTTRETIVSVRVGTASLRVLGPPFSDFRVDQEVQIDWDGATLYLFEAEGGRRLICQARIGPGDGSAGAKTTR